MKKHLFKVGKYGYTTVKRHGRINYCTICGCDNGSLLDDCPGYRVSDDVQEDIKSGGTTYEHGEWRNG